ncbi:unnamed protein product, partial [Ectocarpus sp. 12 AP-2014]
ETSRLHFRQHTEEQCALHNSPEARDDPTLWHVTPEGQETFLWNSSRAESKQLLALGGGASELEEVSDDVVFSPKWWAQGEFTTYNQRQATGY